MNNSFILSSLLKLEDICDLDLVLDGLHLTDGTGNGEEQNKNYHDHADIVFHPL